MAADVPRSPEEAQNIFWQEITRLNENAQSTTAILTAASLDSFLQTIITSKMPKLNADLRDKMFSGYGPFSSFSAKIDSAYAMGLIDKTMHTEMHIVRRIRNEFSHPKDFRPVTFQHPALKTIFEKFADYTDHNVDKSMFLTVKFKDMLKRLQPAINAAYLMQGIHRKGASAPPSSN
ncbi:hypothetical protein [Nitratireductor sp. StC3]|uniref:hypothetical protein n=1 Tax=Nitratireductor sp. StC3 TaxID=2126741 RepID=UPI000D0D4D38|nr:hypothetical protein [Nitratireductor sp. StC3]PSM18157.1 hypothetical protein C7T96_09770 [Nitratireductor sp. StC3]